MARAKDRNRLLDAVRKNQNVAFKKKYIIFTDLSKESKIETAGKYKNEIYKILNEKNLQPTILYL